MTTEAKTRTDMNHLAAFRQSLAQTIAWCTARIALAGPERCLRTSALYPGPLHFKHSLAERRARVASVIQARSRLLRAAGRARHQQPTLPVIGCCSSTRMGHSVTEQQPSVRGGSLTTTTTTSRLGIAGFVAIPGRLSGTSWQVTEPC